MPLDAPTSAKPAITAWSTRCVLLEVSRPAAPMGRKPAVITACGHAVHMAGRHSVSPDDVRRSPGEAERPSRRSRAGRSGRAAAVQLEDGGVDAIVAARITVLTESASQTRIRSPLVFNQRGSGAILQ